MRQIRILRGIKPGETEAFGFDPKHWAQIEAGRRINGVTLLRICEGLRMTLSDLTHELDTPEIYDLDETLRLRALKQIARDAKKRTLPG